jgi:hypothetical protein
VEGGGWRVGNGIGIGIEEQKENYWVKSFVILMDASDTDTDADRAQLISSNDQQEVTNENQCRPDASGRGCVPVHPAGTWHTAKRRKATLITGY